MTSPSGKGYLDRLGSELHKRYADNRRVLSFAEYLDLACAKPRVQLRSAPQYALDCFDHYGTDDVAYPWGKVRRFRLFDCPWADGRERLIGHEEVQNRVYRALANFVREGAANKLILLHGPNGSAKSTLIRCIGRALQHYSTLDEGALYRINWLFPSQKVARSGIGFAGGKGEHADTSETYAYLPDDMIDAKLADELRDHPLLLIPVGDRQRIIAEILARNGDRDGDGAAEPFVVADYIAHGRLSHKNRAIYEALLASYQGDYLKVLRHVQIERFYIQHRYREGYVTVEPQLSVDAAERQVTADRSVSALPAALQSVSLFEYGGEVVNANRGLIEYSDLLKRPLEAYKYLLTTVERASISLQSATLFLDLVFVGTTNEIHLSAFKEIAEFQSFRGRLELVRVPYLLDFTREQQIYEDKIREAAGARHVAPHCAYVAALWSVLTRMRRPIPEAYEGPVRDVLAELGPLDKAELYALGAVPEGLGEAQARELIAHIGEIRAEWDSSPMYEGRTGASVRELLAVVFNAANSPTYGYVSPLAILDEIVELCKQASVYEFLKQDAQPGGFHDHRAFVGAVRGRLLDRIDDDVRTSMGLVEESEYARLFQRYVTHVMHWTKREKVRNPTTGSYDDPDEAMMREVERTLEITSPRETFRNALIGKIGAWSLDNPRVKPDYAVIFADHVKKLRASYFEERRQTIRRDLQHLLAELSDDASGLSDDDRAQAVRTVAALCERFGYRRDSARDAVRLLYRERY